LLKRPKKQVLEFENLKKISFTYKNIIMRILLVLFFLCIVFFPSYAMEVIFYVAPNGYDSNMGTIESPFNSLERAKTAILDYQNKMEAGNIRYVICLRGGTYHIKQSVIFDENFPGGIGNSVKIKNYKEEQVIFSGGTDLPSEAFHAVTDKSIIKRLRPEARNQVLEFDMRANQISYDSSLTRFGFAHDLQPSSSILFFNKEYQQLARWPNAGKLPVGKVIDPGTKPRWEKNVPSRGAIFHYDYERAKEWESANDIWLYGVFSNGYSDDNIQVEYFDTRKKILKTVQPHIYGVYSSEDSSNWDIATSRHLRGYYVYNLLEEIDQPGEYYLDRENGKLYFWPPSPIENAEVELSQTTSPFLVFYNTSNITVKGITFECSRGMGIFMNYAANIIVDSCTFRNLGLIAVSIGETYNSVRLPQLKNPDSKNTIVNRNNQIVNCTIYNTGSGAIYLEGGDRKQLKPGNNRIENCDISNYCKVNNGGVSAVKLKGVGNMLLHCYIHDAPNMAVWIWGNNHLLEYNHFQKVCTESSDAGAVYTGRNPSAQGTVIRYNFFDSIVQAENMVCAIYLDDGTCGYKVYSNVFYRCGSSGSPEGFGTFHINSGLENYMANNVFVECRKAYSGTLWPDKKWINYLTNVVAGRLERVNIDSETYQKAYPMLKTLRDTVNFPLRINYTANDLLYNCWEYSTGMWQHSNSLQTFKDPGFEDAANKNFMLKETSIAFKMLPGFLPVPFDKIGLLKKNN
jgi:hypothetical protein